MPSSGSEAMDWIQALAASIFSWSLAATLMVPSSPMSILAPVFSTISRITLPPEPITSRILSTGILMVSILGACSPSSARGASMAFDISSRMCRRPAEACVRACSMISLVMPATLMSI
ncbi:hypothetical protein D3C80_924250 [compost metagenome]